MSSPFEEVPANSAPELTMFKVGDVCPVWPALRARGAGTIYEYDGRETHALVLNLDRPTPNEVVAVRRAPLRVALAVEEGVVFLMYRFGSTLTGDAPYSAHLASGTPGGPVGQPAQSPHSPQSPSSDRPLCHVMLVNARDGVLCAQRVVTFDRRFMKALDDAVAEQLARPWHGPHAHDRAIARVYARYDFEALWRRARVRSETAKR